MDTWQDLGSVSNKFTAKKLDYFSQKYFTAVEV